MSDTNTINHLRSNLFEVLAAVKAGTLDLDRARAVNELGKTIIETAKVEVDYMRVTGGNESAFMGAPADGAAGGLLPGITGRVVHRLKG